MFRSAGCRRADIPSRALALALGLTVVVGVPALAGAQSVSDRTPQALFGGDRPNQNGQSLDLNWSVLGAYDDNVLADKATNIDESSQIDGAFGAGAAFLGYTARGEHATLNASFGSGGRYYPELSDLTAFEAVANVNVAAALGRNLSVMASQSFAYEPYYQFGFISGLVPSNPELTRTNDHAIGSVTSYDYESSVRADAKLGARSSLVVDYSRRQTRYANSDEQFHWWLGNVRFLRNLTRNAALRLGYGYGEAQNTVDADGPVIANHVLDLGVDYSRALSFSRRTTLTFASGSTLTKQNDVNYFVVNADVGVAREIGRTWRAIGGYHRGVQFMAGFADPLMADTVQFQVGGLLSRRSDLRFSTGYSRGQVGFTSDDQEYSTYSASAGFRLLLNRWLSFDTQYFYYRYGFDDAVSLPFGLSRDMGRHGFRSGLSGWLPLFR